LQYGLQRRVRGARGQGAEQEREKYSWSHFQKRPHGRAKAI
jgi:hypothetical protein